MAHEIDFSNNRANVAFVGQKLWHNLGVELSENSGIDTWKEEAGMNWNVEFSQVLFQDDLGINSFNDKKVLYRSDTKAPLSVVGSDYNVVHPGEILEFFRDLVESHDMKLSTAGVLFGGKRFWALAELGKDFEVISGDKVNGYLLLTTSVDGSLATTAKVTSIRVACNNLLGVALNESSKHLIKVSHKSVWDASKVKIDLGLIDAGWDRFVINMRKLAATPMSNDQVRQFFADITYNKELEVEKQSWLAVSRVNDLMKLYAGGAGAEMTKGTAWGALNAVTEMYTHKMRIKDDSRKFWSAMYDSDKQKLQALDKLLATA